MVLDPAPSSSAISGTRAARRQAPASSPGRATGDGREDGVPESLLAALALVLVIEGLLPLVAPRVWRDSFRRLVDLSDGQLRFIGLVAIVLGLVGFCARLPCVSGSCPSTSRTSSRPRPSASRRCAACCSITSAPHGYRLVQPPLVEHLESLLTGTGRDLDLQTFKVVDPLSGRLLGVRADITPQVARIDAHLLNEPGVTRLCYAGSVLRTVPGGTRRDARSAADRRRALRRARHRRRPRGARAAAVVAGGRGSRRPAPRPRPRRRLSRARRGRGHRAATARTPSSSPRSAPRTCPRSPSSRRSLPAAWRDALARAADALRPGRRGARRARARLPDTPAIRNALAALAALAQAARGRRSTRCTSISPT